MATADRPTTDSLFAMLKARNVETMHDILTVSPQLVNTMDENVRSFEPNKTHTHTHTHANTKMCRRMVETMAKRVRPSKGRGKGQAEFVHP